MPRFRSWTRRRAAVLIVVLAMLALFSIIALTFVLYAESEATASRVYREAADLSVAPGSLVYSSGGHQAADDITDEPTSLLSAYALAQLIYDVNDDESGVYSALRGHSLARTMYGWDQAAPAGQFVHPYSGIGRIRTGPGTYLTPYASDDLHLINYQYFPNDFFVRDPERTTRRSHPGAPRGAYLGCNAPYTAADLNNLFLAAVRADGRLLTPSFHRTAVFGELTGPNVHWNNEEGKYRLLRPRPKEMGPGFPMPSDSGGDVKNLVGGLGGNDSLWLDLDYPVRTTRSGKRYKPLFAFLVVDLDGRINLSVHGNRRGNGPHRSNQGWGPWEVNPARVLTADGGMEARNLLAVPPGSVRRGRYGVDGVPQINGSVLTAAPKGPPYAGVDYDACDETHPDRPPTQRWTMPTSTLFLGFPRFPNGYGNGSVNERAGHPALFNPFVPESVTTPDGDYVFSPVNVKQIAFVGTTGTEALLSDIGKLCPINLDNSRTRRMVTTLSSDVDRPGIMPGVFNPVLHPYRLTQPTVAPRGSATPSPMFGATPPANSDYLNGQSRAATLGRLNLAQPLTPYPHPDATGRITDSDAFHKAQKERQDFARAVFERLRLATSAVDPDLVTPGSPEENALRWLAQLAVNIVDFIDSDDYMTPFQWKANDPSAWVFGTELPRLVLNEAYAEIRNDPADPGPSDPMIRKATPGQNYRLDFWIELHNPLPADSTRPDNGAARLRIPEAGGQPAIDAYRIEINRAGDPELDKFFNTRGSFVAPPKLVLRSFTAAPGFTPAPGVDPLMVRTGGGNYSGPDRGNNGFSVLGPDRDFPGAATTRPQATLRVRDPANNAHTDALSYRISNDTSLIPIAGEPLLPHTILLRRLACPHRPHNDTPGPEWNPYITVDVIEKLPTNDAVEFTQAGANARLVPVHRRTSQGRIQPFAASEVRDADPVPSPPAVSPTQPRHTFFRHNGQQATPPLSTGASQTLQTPFDWLTHLDREPISPIEILWVSGFKPHQLTRRFVHGGQTFQHFAPWLEPESRLYRALELFSVGDRMGGSSGGRQMGRININTIWDVEIFQALCDAQPTNRFDATHVATVFQELVASRSTGPGGTPGLNDRPFRSLGVPHVNPGDRQFPDGMGLTHTVFRNSTTSGSPLFDVPGASHPYLKKELITKIANSLTTRSHVFAVWCTVGFFEVLDDPANPSVRKPYRLGAEIGSDRRRFFAVVDRSNLAIDPSQPHLQGFWPILLNTESVISAPGTHALKLPRLHGVHDGEPSRSWNIRVGDKLVVGLGANREIVTVTAIDLVNRTITASFTRVHPIGTLVSNVLLGNPGPQPDFDPIAERYAGVVRYFHFE